MRVTFISWAPYCSRSDYIARGLGGTSHMVYWGWLGSHPATVWLKYLGQTLSTWRVLVRERPDVVFVMSPPPVAIAPIYAYCLLSRSRFVVDAHTGVFLTARWRVFQQFQYWLCRRANATVVTNDHLAGLLREQGARPVVVPDVPIVFDADGAPPTAIDGFTAVCVTSFDRDEPVPAMAEAARAVPDVRFFMTGDRRRAAEAVGSPLPANLVLTGFLDDVSYGALVKKAGVVIALTTDDHTMQRAAYEAIYNGTPVIVSDTALLREAFDEGAIHVDNSPGAIAGAVRRVRDDAATYRAAAARLQVRKYARWARSRAALIEAMKQEKP